MKTWIGRLRLALATVIYPGVDEADTFARVKQQLALSDRRLRAVTENLPVIMFGGYKRSGLGREYGENWLNEYTQEKSVIFPVGR